MVFDTKRLVSKSNLKVDDKGKIKFPSYGEKTVINLLALSPTVREDGCFVFYDKESGNEICHIGLTNKRGRLEVTYGTEMPFRNKGYMTEALISVVNWMFENTSEDTIWALPNGSISAKILKKCGFVDCGGNESYEGVNWFKREKV